MNRDRRAKKRVIVYRAAIPDSSEIWEVEYEAVADALHFACRDLRENRRAPIEILEDGARIYDAEGIERACRDQAAWPALIHELSSEDEAADGS